MFLHSNFTLKFCLKNLEVTRGVSPIGIICSTMNYVLIIMQLFGTINIIIFLRNLIKATTTWLWIKLLVMIYNGWSSFVIHNSTRWHVTMTRSTMLSNSWYLKMHGWSRDLLLYFFLTWRFTIIFFINRQESSHLSIEFYLKNYYIFIIIYQKALSNPAATRGESPSQKLLLCQVIDWFVLTINKEWRQQ